MSSQDSLFAEMFTKGLAYIPKEDIPPLKYLIPAVLVALPFVIVALNVAYQLFWPKNPNLPPVVFHYIPFLGSAVSYGMDPYKFMFDQREKYGDLFTFVLIGRKMTVALGPKGNDMILGGKLSQVSAEEAYTPLTTPVFGKGVVYDCPNSMLMEQKKFVKFGLSTENLKAYIPMIIDEFDGLVSVDSHFHPSMKDRDGWSSFPVLKVMSELTILTASRTLQGPEVRAALDSSFAQRYNDLDGGFVPVNMFFPNFPSANNRKRDIAQKAMGDFYKEIIAKRRAEGATDKHDMIANLMESKYRDGRLLNDTEIAHIMIALLMAGQHTSSATSSWTLLEIAANPDIAEQLYEEQVKFFGLPGGGFREMNLEELHDLPVLDSCIRETLRIHAPIHSIMRKVISDIPVPQSLSAPSENSAYIIPEGYFLMACPGVAQMDTRVWNEAKKWKPSRWTEAGGAAAAAATEYDDVKGEKVDYGFGAISKGTLSPYQPFGSGRHRCIGETFAYLQLSVIISRMIQKYELKLPSKMPEPNYQTMIVLPHEHEQVMFKARA